MVNVPPLSLVLEQCSSNSAVSFFPVYRQIFSPVTLTNLRQPHIKYFLFEIWGNVVWRSQVVGSKGVTVLKT